ncbi:lytic polysaccharide monooxygenase [Zopfia rhizophila CBS 207.26]|uniref:Lytic polysaccharide monooxygenase n=1 Tax=Zopfia rhizophila CBS 207.26 TaxID=1314779 RepID=A0A6A6DXV2_9PEZI|nr:lytic polysaccharide monooxygenase [Zopfia rhizophila CBS 207.26]
MWFTYLIPIVASVAPLASAHGRITNITTENGFVYEGWDPEMAFKDTVPPQLAAWSASNLGNIYVTPSSFNNSNITCHKNALPGALHVNTTAGQTLKLRWNEWPVSHKGPVLTYLASCNASCTNVDKDQLKWVKVDQQGWLNSSGWVELGGTWASDVLIANGFTWTVKVPENLAEGAYVLRHEIIALHVANETDGAQAYPQCVNIRVGKGSGTSASGNEFKRIEGGVDGRKLYGAKDKGILVDIHYRIKGYDIPGPAIWNGATTIKQPNEKRRMRKGDGE